MSKTYTQKSQEKFKEINEFLGNALSILDYPDIEVIERDEEIRALEYLMNRRQTPVACLIGDAGTGKTAIVKTYAKQQFLNGNHVIVLSVNIGALNSGGVHNLKERMEWLLPKVKEYQDVLQEEEHPDTKVIIFIDEVHRIISVFGNGSKEGGDILKPTLASAGKYVKVITATTRGEYDRYIAKDGALARRLHTLAINEVSQKTTKQILRNWLDKTIGEAASSEVSDNTLERIMKANRQMQTEFAEPSKSIDILETMLSIHETDGRTMDRELVNYVFRTSNNVDLNPQIDPVHTTNVLRRRVRGQPLVLYTMERMIDNTAWESQSNEVNQRPTTVLMVGTSGTGKTETAKAISEATKGDESELEIFSMTDYDNAESSDRFRLDLGMIARHKRSAIFLFDEIEKAHPSVILAMLPILDEGEVTFFEEGADGYMVRQHASLRGSFIFATSNSGSEMFEDINRYARELQDIKQDEIDNYSEELKFSSRKLEPVIQKGLEKDFPKELLQRFTYFIPFNSLSNSTKLDIANKMLAEELRQFKERGYNIYISDRQDWMPGYAQYKANEIAMYIVFERMMSRNAGASGARNIRKIIKTDIVSEILYTMRKYPNLKRFRLKTNGKCSFESRDDAVTRGAIIVEPY
ncbi:AAA family ATPase [Macrococcus carouselicus]|uniref:ATP-dependent Clp protease ATP-binding subunit n=1 Tax=Macrococcus carouselicus TaxID=69969 RepID=A0A9Q8FPM8_9STAP|nr:AAA family ATPase [Macrococcus carouselicus]TDL95544.1 ATP-dependent Clp protease ATP-binding subunit [Macrococcus carouselicus]